MAKDVTPGVHFHDSSAGGEAGRLIRETDWKATALGARDAWPRSLNNYLSMILELPTAAIIFWGPDQVQLYNDGYAVIMGPRHPKYLGATFRECWPEAYETIHPWMRRVLVNGETVEVNRTLVPLTRHGFIEEAYFTFSFTPLRDDEGRIAGVLQIVTEVTSAVLAERRTAALHELSNQTALARTPEDATRLAAQVLGTCAADLPFFLLYLIDSRDSRSLALSGSGGLREGHEPFPRQIDLQSETAGRFPELAQVVRERKPSTIDGLATRFGAPFVGTWPEPPEDAVAWPIATPDQKSLVAVFVAGISPRLELDNHYRGFLTLVSAQLGTLLSAARAYDDERKRAEALAALDRAKTEFFGNVSHEFRTPLTLILGPLEDALRDPSKALRGDALEIVHRNALRLLRLVNTLLDFARLEASRLTPSLEPTDLPVLTAGLAGSFQSLLDSAGLTLRVDCPPIPEPVYVDRSQWEKIVLNLVSNAFKFTFEGAITVRLRESEGFVHLTVSDTGTGIPEDELPKIFERFHRVAGARGRSFEGTGIGLALVRELVAGHGGSVTVESTVGRGSTFVVTIPRGAARLPDGRIPAGAHAVSGSAAAACVTEASQWRATGAVTSEVPAGQWPAAGTHDPVAGARILVADDNADMREYLARLLSTRWMVSVAEDGQAALESARQNPPDLVLSDVMMPRMDGVALLKALRGNPETAMVPVVLLSARAGEEAVVGGLDTGADDYLVKPFSARELVSRVGTHLEMARIRRLAAETARELAETRATLLADLERKNQELEAFSYSVSHDLRAPLRAIDGFSQVLLEDFGEQLGPEGQHTLQRVRAATERMGQLIEDLLTLARVERAELHRDKVDLSPVARRLGSALQRQEPERNVEFVVHGGLVANVDARLIEIVLENLLGNAWKFTRGTPSPRVEIGSREQDGDVVFYVRDNGAGFDPQHGERLFKPFQRLHSAKEFPGTGIGLATVRRIIERHGGRVWAESEPGRGATFHWSLPGRRG